MNYRQDYLFWNLIHLFVVHLEYRIVKISENQNEVWLEGLEKDKGQIIRVLRYDLDWGNWLQRDMEQTLFNVDLIRKKLRKKSLHALNIYVSTYPPVDDWQHRIDKPLSIENQSTLDSFIIESSQTKDELLKLSSILNIPLPYDENIIVEEEDIDRVKRKVVSVLNQRSKDEQRLFNQGKPYLTYVFMSIQIILYLVMEFMGGSTNTLTLLKMGAKYNPLILDGEWWRFFTPVFLHIGFLHLAMNTLALYYLGIAVEKIYGNTRFFFIYLFSGFMGSLASFVFSSSMSAGASGAIFGCFGALLYFGMIYPNLFKRTMGNSILAMIGINLFFGFAVPGIDNAGHIGGLIGGFLATGIVHIPKHKLILKQFLFLGFSALLTFSLLFYGFHHPKSNDPALLVGLAQEYIQDKQYDKVVDLLEHVHASKQTGAQINFLLSYAEIQLGDIPQAKKHLELAIKQDPNFHQAYYNLALVYLEKQQYSKAKLAIDQAVKIDPKNKKYIGVQKNINQHIEGSE